MKAKCLTAKRRGMVELFFGKFALRAGDLALAAVAKRTFKNVCLARCFAGIKIIFPLYL